MLAKPMGNHTSRLYPSFFRRASHVPVGVVTERHTVRRDIVVPSLPLSAEAGSEETETEVTRYWSNACTGLSLNCPSTFEK